MEFSGLHRGIKSCADKSRLHLLEVQVTRYKLQGTKYKIYLPNTLYLILYTNLAFGPRRRRESAKRQIFDRTIGGFLRSTQDAVLSTKLQLKRRQFHKFVYPVFDICFRQVQ